MNPGFEHASVDADADRLMQVMANLLSNAIKFFPRGEVVSVDIHPAGKFYRVSITNAGEGIPDEFRDCIFSRFAQADGSSTRQLGGTGLGLNIVKEIVTRLKGEVGFDSRPGEGATFYFTLPAAASRKAEILICTAGGDFERDWAKLEEHPIRLRFAASIDDVRQLVKTSAFAAVILDVRLTEAYRTQMVQAIQHHAANSPLIIMAGHPGTATGRVTLSALLEWLDRPAPATPRGSDEVLSDPPPGGRILHVEDDEDILTLVAGTFGGGTEVIAARTLSEGLDVLHKNRLDAVILDLELGSDCGLELLPTIRQLHPAVPVVIFSASDAEASAGAEVDAVLTKSRVTLEDVVSTVRTLISARRR